jgi:histidinol-phosphate aminotransferase
MTHPRYTDLIAALPSTVPFVGPDEQERDRGAVFRARLGANESLFGPSPKAIDVLKDLGADIWKYGDPTHFDLKSALTRHLGCAMGNIIVGEGIDGLLGNMVRLLISPGDAVVTSDGAYPTFNYHVAGFGGTLHKVPYRDDREDLPALIAKAHEVQATIIYLANPDNPMGTWLEGSEIEAALDSLPEGCILALDEAYIEFAPQTALPNIAFEDPRVLRFRTFSKGYGMAGARIGYAFGAADLIRAFDKIRNHFGVNQAALAMASAAIDDQDWLDHVRDQVRVSKESIAQIAQDNGLSTLPSATNFVAMDCGRDGAFAKAVLDGLMAQGIFVRMPFVAPQNRCIRISTGRPEDMALLAQTLPGALAQARKQAG